MHCCASILPTGYWLLILDIVHHLANPRALALAQVVERDTGEVALQQGAERVFGGSQQLDGESGHVVGDGLAVAIDDQAARGRQGQAAQAGGLEGDPALPYRTPSGGRLTRSTTPVRTTSR